jgi:hypothetical protein
MASPEREALRQAPAALAQLSQDPDVQGIRLYSYGEACGSGSRTRGEARAGSEHDLLRERQLSTRTRALLLPLLRVDLDLLISDAA